MPSSGEARGRTLARALRFGGVLYLRHSWVLVGPAGFLIVALWLGTAYEAWGALPLASTILCHAALGLLGSYVVHEFGHYLALSLCDGVVAVSVESSLFRLSLQPEGQLSARAALGAALAGPLSAVVVGAGIWGLLPGTSLEWWYLAHLIFLAPFFGDGRAAAIAAARLAAPSSPPAAG